MNNRECCKTTPGLDHFSLQVFNLVYTCSRKKVVEFWEDTVDYTTSGLKAGCAIFNSGPPCENRALAYNLIRFNLDPGGYLAVLVVGTGHKPCLSFHPVCPCSSNCGDPCSHLDCLYQPALSSTTDHSASLQFPLLILPDRQSRLQYEECHVFELSFRGEVFIRLKTQAENRSRCRALSHTLDSILSVCFQCTLYLDFTVWLSKILLQRIAKVHWTGIESASVVMPGRWFMEFFHALQMKIPSCHALSEAKS